MNKLNKLHLFLSYSDPYFNKYAKDFYTDFKESELFLSYKIRKEKRKDFDKNIDDDSRFDQPFISIEQGYVRLAQFYYLATTSFERYYINPLMIEEKNVSTNSLGDLLIPFDNALLSINSVITIKGYSEEYKDKALLNAIDKWKIDAEKSLREPLNTIRKSNAEYMLSKKFIVLNIIQNIFFFILNAFAIFLLFVPGLKEVWANFFKGDHLNYATWILFITVALYDFVYCFYSMFFRRIIEPYYYTKRFLALKKKDLDKMIDKASLRLKSYLFNALHKKKILKNDIKMFADITEHKVDLNSLEKVNHKIHNPLFKTINLIKNIIFIIMLVLVIIYSIYLIYYSRLHGGLL